MGFTIYQFTGFYKYKHLTWRTSSSSGQTSWRCLLPPVPFPARGIAPEAIHMVRKEMERWADGFTHPAENVEETVDELRMNPLIPKDVPIHGLIFHPRTGEIEVIVNGYTQMKQYYEK